MRRRAAAVVLLLAASLAACVTSGAPASRAPIGLASCAGKLVVRPRTLTLACADANFYATGLRWTGWGETFAAAQGTAHVNDCKPYCAAGKFHTYPVLLLAAGRQVCGGRPAYARITYAFPGRSPFPRGSAADATIPYRCR